MIVLTVFAILFGLILGVQFFDYCNKRAVFEAKLTHYRAAGGKPWCGKNMIGYKNPIIIRKYDIPILAQIQQLIDWLLPEPKETYPKDEAEWNRQQEVNKQARISCGLGVWGEDLHGS